MDARGTTAELGGGTPPQLSPRAVDQFLAGDSFEADAARAFFLATMAGEVTISPLSWRNYCLRQAAAKLPGSDRDRARRLIQELDFLRSDPEWQDPVILPGLSGKIPYPPGRRRHLFLADHAAAVQITTINGLARILAE